VKRPEYRKAGSMVTIKVIRSAEIWVREAQERRSPRAVVAKR
jgi:hypothetical protein